MQESPTRAGEAGARLPIEVDISIVMPCLNERNSLPHCILNAREALAAMKARFGFNGEIVVADNGSTDGSQMIATGLGARVADVPARGYGAALIGGANAARGRFVVMGDSDGSYNFLDAVEMVGLLRDGADLCMGSRFRGGIAPGAMPFKNRYIGNPALTGILNLFFRAGVDDAHCGLRAIRKEAFDRLALSGQGMEFASEMVVKASLKKLRIVQAPASLSRDLRDRPPHLRPWRDGWRHLRYLLFLSPMWSFGVPALGAMSAATFILAEALLHLLQVFPGETRFGASWTIAAGFLLVNGHLAAVMATTAHLHAVNAGERELSRTFRRFAKLMTLETTTLAGAALIVLSLVGYGLIGRYWAASGYEALPSTLPLVLAAVCGAIGVQTIFGGFLLGNFLGRKGEFVDAPLLEKSDHIGARIEKPDASDKPQRKSA